MYCRTVFEFLALLSFLCLSSPLHSAEPGRPQPGPENGPQDIFEKVPVGPLPDDVFLQYGEIKIPFSAVQRAENAYVANEKKEQPRMNVAPELMVHLRKQFGFQYLVNAVIEKYANDNKLEITKDKFEELFAQTKKEVTNNGKLSYEQYLLNYGLMDEDFRRSKNANWAIEQKMFESVKDDENTKNEVTRIFTQSKDSVPLRKVSHILFAYKGAQSFELNPPVEQLLPPATRTKEEAKAAADEALTQLQNGADIAGLAKEKSDCPISKTHDGNLEFISLKGLRPKHAPLPFAAPLGEAAYKLGKIGDIAEFESPYGYHLVKLTGLKTQDDYKDDIKKFLGRQLYQKQVRQLIEEAVPKATYNEKMLKIADKEKKRNETK